MSKLKTKSAAVKRFKCGGTGNLKHRSANRNHILTKKLKNRKRRLNGMHAVHSSDVRAVKIMCRCHN